MPASSRDEIHSISKHGFARQERSCLEKVAYTHDEAIAARAGIAKRSRGRQRTRIYKCRFCNLYHPDQRIGFPHGLETRARRASTGVRSRGVPEVRIRGYPTLPRDWPSRYRRVLEVPYAVQGCGPAAVNRKRADDARSRRDRESLVRSAMGLVAEMRKEGASSGTIACPACRKQMFWTYSPPLGKVSGRCSGLGGCNFSIFEVPIDATT